MHIWQIIIIIGKKKIEIVIHWLFRQDTTDKKKGGKNKKQNGKGTESGGKRYSNKMWSNLFCGINGGLEEDNFTSNLLPNQFIQKYVYILSKN